jgi:hypothetical protein
MPGARRGDGGMRAARLRSAGVRRPLAALLPLGLLIVVAAGCGGGSPQAASRPAAAAAPVRPSCAYRLGWQRLANRISADVYCPGWLPGPLTSQIGGGSNNINVVSSDRSYLESFIWQDTDTPGISGVLHVILRGYPGRTAIPTCLAGIKGTTPTPCFAGVNGHVTEHGIRATLYTVNQDADAWHIVLLWRHKGGLYTVSEHLAPPLNYPKVVSYLKRELAALVLIAPSRST